MNKIISLVVGVIFIALAYSIISEVLQESESPVGNEGVDDSDLYVFVLAGQSQAAYRAYDVAVANELPGVYDGQAWYYGSSSSPIYYNSNWQSWDYSTLGINSMTNPDGTWRIGSMESAFASKWVNSTGKSILIVNTAISGRSIASFIDGQEGWAYASTMLDDALSKIPDSYKIHYGGIIWLHGQANLTASAEWYVGRFGEVYAQYKEYGFNKCVIEQPRASEAPTIDIANEIICDTYKGCYIGSTFGTNNIVNGGPYLYDGTHYNQKGRNIVGVELASCYTDIVYRDLAWVSPPGVDFKLLWILPTFVIVLGVVESAKMIIARRT